MTKLKIGSLEVSADFWGNKDWCVQVKTSKEALRFFLPGADEAEANAKAAILANMIRESGERK